MTVSFEEFDRRIQEADASWNVAVWGQMLLQLLVEDSTINLATVEKRLRERESRTFFLAAPQDNLPDNMPPGIRVQHPDGTPATYWLWIGLHGPEETEQMMVEFEIPSAEENLKRLIETGFLMLA